MPTSKWMIKAHDVADEKRDSSGKWTAGGADAAEPEEMSDEEAQAQYRKDLIDTAKQDRTSALKEAKDQHKYDTKEFQKACKDQIKEAESGYKEELKSAEEERDQQIDYAKEWLESSLEDDTSEDDKKDLQQEHDDDVQKAHAEFERAKRQAAGERDKAIREAQRNLHDELAEVQRQHDDTVDNAHLSFDESMVQAGELDHAEYQSRKKAVAHKQLKAKLQRLKERHDREAADALADYEAEHGTFEDAPTSKSLRIVFDRGQLRIRSA